jgi:hypothetical protein
VRTWIRMWVGRAGSPRGRGVGVLVLGIAVFGWLAVAAGGLGVLASYATATDVPGRAPSLWPAQTGLPRAGNATRVVVFLHPRCPCSSATVGELARVLARAPRGVEITLAYYAPSTEPAVWGRTALRSAGRSLNAREFDDVDGLEARRFGAVNSGHVVAYGPDRRLRFAGGITPSRGHQGDNAGEDSLIAVLQGQAPRMAATPTYGCAIASETCPLCAGEDEP